MLWKDTFERKPVEHVSYRLFLKVFGWYPPAEDFENTPDCFDCPGCPCPSCSRGWDNE